MRVSRWGNSLAVRLPADLVREKGLKEGDEVSITVESMIDEKARARADAIATLRNLRGMIPADYRFKREDAYDDEE